MDHVVLQNTDTLSRGSLVVWDVFICRHGGPFLCVAWYKIFIQKFNVMYQTLENTEESRHRSLPQLLCMHSTPNHFKLYNLVTFVFKWVSRIETSSVLKKRAENYEDDSKWCLYTLLKTPDAEKYANNTCTIKTYTVTVLTHPIRLGWAGKWWLFYDQYSTVQPWTVISRHISSYSKGFCCCQQYLS